MAGEEGEGDSEAEPGEGGGGGQEKGGGGGQEKGHRILQCVGAALCGGCVRTEGG